MASGRTSTGISSSSPDAHRFIGDMGALFAGAGGTEVAGRIIGWLMISDPPEQSLAEIQRAVDASKASVSTVTRMLMRAGFIERTAATRARTICFRVREDAWTTLVEDRFRMMDRLVELGERGRAILEGMEPHARRRLDEMVDFYSFMQRELKGVAKRWRKHRGGKRPGGKRS